MNFKELGLREELILGLKKEKIIEPRPVQEEIFKKVISGSNLVVQSQTGTGKTLAFLLPLIQNINMDNKNIQVLVLVPTHELAMQVYRQIQTLSKNSGLGFSAAAIVGNVNITRQLEALKAKPQIVVGTCGRIYELIQKRKLKVHEVKTVVIDEADKLVDRNNIKAVKDVLKCCLRDIYVLLFSASTSKITSETLKELGREFESIKTTKELSIPKSISHIYLVTERRDKLEVLRKLAKSINPQKAMVFINKASDIEEATQKLQYHKYNAKCIYGEVKKQDRHNTIREFDNGKLQFLIATDIAARGLDFKNVSTVFHISIPEQSQDYLHRAGRTGRTEEKGLSVLIITKEEMERIKQFQRELGIQIQAKKMYQGKIVRG
jgi:Superfamily II DNA and RNA helicases